MKNNLLSPALKKLINEKSDLFVSMIIPLHEIPAFKKMDAIVIDHAITKLKALIEPVHPADTVRAFISKIRYLKDEIRHINGVKGIGIFMSETTFHTETFPFEVKEKIQAGSSFEVRDLIRKEIYLREYLVLSLTGHEVKLFRGRNCTLAEVNDANFPAAIHEGDVEIPVTADMAAEAGAAPKRQRSQIMESHQSFHNALDKKLLEYVHPEHMLLLAGVEKELAAFEAGTIHKDKIRGKVTGSYDHYNLAQLETKCGELMHRLQLDEEQQIVSSLAELFGRELVSVGVTDVWRSAKTGRGNLLVVEKDLSMPGFVGEDDYQLWLSPPNEKHSIHTDAVDDIIEAVIEKNGKVMFVENGRLREFQGIAMINRY